MHAICDYDTCMALTTQTNYCSLHVESVLHVSVGPSSLADAGWGLFTTIDRQKHRRIVPYLGDRIADHGDDSIGGAYHLEYAPGLLIDASSPTCCAGRFANDKRSFHGNNCKFVLDQLTQVVWIVSKRFIAAGSELFVSYGSQYWRSCGAQAEGT